MLSTYYETVFIKAVENERNKFRISNPIEIDKLLKCTYYILSKAFESKHIHTNSNFIQILHENYDENVDENYDIPKKNQNILQIKKMIIIKMIVLILPLQVY